MTFPAFFGFCRFSPFLLLFLFLEIIHFGMAALVLNFFPVWLESLYFGKEEMVNILSAEAGMRFVGFFIATLFSGRGLGKNARFILFFAFFSIVSAFLFVINAPFLFFLIITISFFSGLWIVTPYVEAYCMTLAEMEGWEYSKLISVGTLAFIVSSLFCGVFFQSKGIKWFPYVLLVLAILQFLFLFFFRFFYIKKCEKQEKTQEKKQSIGPIERKSKEEHLSLRRVLANKNLLILIFISMFVFGAHAGHGAYTTLLWHANGWSEDKIGLLWSLAISGEFFVFFFFPAKKMKVKTLSYWAIFSILVSFVRFSLSGLFISHFYVQMLLQILSMFTYSLMHLVIVVSILRSVSSKYFAQWQAFYHLASHGIASALIMPIAGFFYAERGVDYFYFLSILCLLALFLSVMYALGYFSKKNLQEE